MRAAEVGREAHVDEVVGLILDQIRDLGAAPASETEVAARKADLIGEFGRTAATSGGLGQMLSLRAVEGVDISEVETHAAGVEAVTAKAAQAAAVRVVDPAAADVVVVGDAKLFVDALRKRFPGLVEVSADALDLEAAGLVKPVTAAGSGAKAR